MVNRENTQNSKPPTDVKIVRPTKKQMELLAFIGEFISAHGYSPSYREIMAGCNYTSVATVSLHVNNLIRRGHLKKRDNSARSLEIVDAPTIDSITINQVNETEEKWFVLRVEQFFKIAEETPNIPEQKIDELYVLIGAMKIFGLDGAAYAYIRRLNDLKKRAETSTYKV
jgi:repressor LexA